MLVVQQQESRRFDESEEALLITLSAQLAGVIAMLKQWAELRDPKFGGVPVSFGARVVRQELRSVRLSCFTRRLTWRKVPYRQVRNTQREIERFERAVASAKEEIQEVASGLVGQIHRETLGIFEAYLQMLDPHAIPFR